YPNGIDAVAPTPTSGGWNFESLIKTIDPDSVIFNKFFVNDIVDMPDPDNGSNNWAVAGWKTKSGNPILCSDMHLGLHLPSLWFLIELNAPDYATMGFTLAGNLGVVSGFNEDISWAFTDVSRDERDWYKIQFKDQSKEEYLFEGTHVKTNAVIEDIKIRGGEVFYDTVIYTHHGPIVYDESFPSQEGEDFFALKWIGHHGSRVQKALLELNQSSNYEDYVNALEYWDSPAQHVAFASTSDNIAIRVQGLWPAKFENQGLFVMSGAMKAAEWGDFIPTSHYAYQFNPDRGFVSSANQHSVDQQYPYWQGWPGPDHYRSRRINQILNSYDSASITPQDMMRLQQDSYGILPSEILPLFLDSLASQNPEVQKDSIFQQLKNWDYIYAAEAMAPAAFISWWKNYKRLLWDEMLHNDSIALPLPTDYRTIQLTKSKIPGSFTDIKATNKKESLRQVISMSYDSMRNDLAQWMSKNDKALTWGNYKSTSIIHMARIPAFSRMNIQVSGEDDAINSTKYNHGPSQRIVIEMSSPPKAWAVIPGGQSGNPGNPAYDNMIEMWQKGEYSRLNFLQRPSEKNVIIFNQELKPAE
ncbi:MAG: penicillin acylase family protein, partial [Fulvivirga sp.]|nr:penicillin acylase family protein [Fulvivirga sp.]